MEARQIGLLTIKDVSDHLGIKEKTLYSWASQGKIPSVKIHGLLRFRKDEIDAWLLSFQNNKDKSAATVKANRKYKSGDKKFIDEMVQKVTQTVYNANCGETRPKSVLRKENDNGAV